MKDVDDRVRVRVRVRVNSVLRHRELFENDWCESSLDVERMDILDKSELGFEMFSCK